MNRKHRRHAGCFPLLAAVLLAVVMPHTAQAADFDLQLTLPDAEWLRPAGSPPQFQREGVPLPDEQRLINDLFGYITQSDYAGALTLVREQHAALLDEIERGDPDGVVRRSVVPGGFSPDGAALMAGPAGATRPNQVSSAFLFVLGHVYRGAERLETAELAFTLALQALPDYLRVHEALGLLYLETGRFAEAQQRLAHAAELGLNTAALHGALGYLNQELDNHWGAASSYQTAMVLEHDNPNWQRGLLYALAATQQYQSGRSLVTQLLQTTPDDPELWLFRANFALQAGERQLGLASLETALRLGDDAAANLQAAATLHLEQGSVARAVQLLQQGMVQGIDYDYVDQALQWLVAEAEWDFLGELLDAVEAQSALSSLQQSRVLTHRAALAVQRDDATAARGALEQALQLDPANADALMALAGLHRAARNYPQAELLYQRATAYESHRENAQVLLAQLAIDQSDFVRALALLREVRERNPARSDLGRNIEALENIVVLQE